MTKPVSGQTTFGASTSGTTTQLDNNFLLAYNAINDYNTYANYLIDSGAANAMVVTIPGGMTGALTDGLLLQIKVKSTNTGATTLNYNAGGALNVTNMDGSALIAGALPINGYVQVQYSSGTTTWLLQTPTVPSASVSASVPIRQTVLGGPVDANGLPTLLPSSCNSIVAYTTANITVSAPLVASAAGGYSASGANNLVGISSVNLTWANLTANQVNYLGVLVAANGNITTFATGNANGAQPTYQWGGTYATVNGNYTFNIQEMIMKAGNGTAASQTFSVFVGECNCNSNSVVTATNYAYLGRYTGALTSMGSAGTAVAFTHNIGVDARWIVMNFGIQNISTDLNYAVGDSIMLGGPAAGGGNGLTYSAGIKTASVNYSAAPTINNKSTGGLAGITLAKWNFYANLFRSW